MNALIPLGLVVLMIALPFRTSAAETTPGMEDAVSRGLARVTGAGVGSECLGGEVKRGQHGGSR